MVISQSEQEVFCTPSVFTLSLNRATMSILILLPWIFLFSLPFLHFGIWMDVEAVAFALCALACIGSFVLCMQIWCLRTITLSTLSLLFGGIAFLSIMFLPFSNLPELSWFGHPEGCLGAWTFLSFFIFTILYHRLQPKDQTAIQGACISASVALGLLTLFFHPYYLGEPQTTFIIYHFTAYLVWPAIGLLLIISTLPTDKQRLFVFSLAIALILLSRCKTAYGTLLLSPVLLLPRLSRTHIIAGCCVLPLIAVLTLFTVYTLGVSESLISRYTSIEVIFNDFIHAQWWRLISGFGFGQMSDAILRNATFLNSAAQNGWEGFYRFDSSSLNQLVDMVAAIGIGGGLAFLFILISPVIVSKKRPPFSVSLAIILSLAMASFWFMMLPVFSIALIGYLAHDKKIVTFYLLPTMSASLMALFFLISVNLGYTSYGFYRTGVFFSSFPSNSYRRALNILFIAGSFVSTAFLSQKARWIDPGPLWGIRF